MCLRDRINAGGRIGNSELGVYLLKETDENKAFEIASKLDDLNKTVKLIKRNKSINYRNINVDKNVSKVSIVGVGMRSHAGVAAKMFETLSGEGINIQMITTSEIKITVVIDKRYIELAVRALHSAFELSEVVKNG